MPIRWWRNWWAMSSSGPWPRSTSGAFRPPAPCSATMAMTSPTSSAVSLPPPACLTWPMSRAWNACGSAPITPPTPARYNRSRSPRPWPSLQPWGNCAWSCTLRSACWNQRTRWSPYGPPTRAMATGRRSTCSKDKTPWYCVTTWRSKCSPSTPESPASSTACATHSRCRSPRPMPWRPIRPSSRARPWRC
ncbi:hypothetical protein C4K09_1285 [Pseudomonas chlororaphis subsp. aureofaciens]|nr:hypothetical protein C4K09_1285 [Pseudomonas chlororaphis subsp. aureofaciens]